MFHFILDTENEVFMRLKAGRAYLIIFECGSSFVSDRGSIPSNRLPKDRRLEKFENYFAGARYWYEHDIKELARVIKLKTVFITHLFCCFVVFGLSVFFFHFHLCSILKIFEKAVFYFLNSSSTCNVPCKSGNTGHCHSYSLMFFIKVPEFNLL